MSNTNTTKIIFNVPVSIKKKAASRAKREGTTLTGFLNASVRAYVEGTLEVSHPELRATPKAIARFKKIAKEARNEKNLSPVFNSAEEMMAWIRK